MEMLKLNNEVEMPVIGIGTFLLAPDEAENSVYNALNMGYKLIDTANAYVNEKAVGRAIKKSGINREEIFVSTKLWPSEYENEDAVEETLKRLGLEYIDLLFLHQPAGNYMAGYRLLEKAYKEGKIRAIGISNFEGEYIEEVLKNCGIKPQVIQVEAYPYYTQEELRKVLEKDDIKLMSWYPLGHGDSSLIEEETFRKIGEKYGKTSAQVILRWHVDMGFVVIPGARKVEHIKDNLDILDFKLTEDEMEQIAKLNKNKRYYYRTDENLANYASFRPDMENQK